MIYQSLKSKTIPEILELFKDQIQTKSWTNIFLIMLINVYAKKYISMCVKQNKTFDSCYYQYI